MLCLFCTLQLCAHVHNCLCIVQCVWRQHGQRAAIIASTISRAEALRTNKLTATAKVYTDAGFKAFLSHFIEEKKYAVLLGMLPLCAHLCTDYLHVVCASHAVLLCTFVI